MKQNFALLSLLFLLLIPIYSCNKSDNAIEKGNYTLVGDIDSEKPINMKLQVSRKGKVKGYFSYADDSSQNQKFRFDGTIYDHDKLTLYVKEDNSDTPIQTWNLIIAPLGDDFTLSGIITDNKSGKAFNVALASSGNSSDVKSIAIAPVNNDATGATDVAAEAPQPAKPKNTTPKPTPKYDIDYNNLFWGSPAVMINGLACHFFDGNFYTDSGNIRPFKVVVIRNNYGDIVRAFYKNMYYQQLPNFELSVYDSADNLYLTGDDGNGTFSLELYDMGGNVFNGDAWVSGKHLPIDLKPTTSTFKFHL